VHLGIDGELVRMEPPLRFRVRPAALRVARGTQHDGSQEA
jgi:diacylglycerol kinase family enzyme